MENKNIKVSSRRSFNISIVSFFALLGLKDKPVLADNVFKLMDMEPIKITVKSLKIQDLYAMPLVDPYVEHRMRRSPSDALIGWVHTILRPIGTEGTAIFKILDASAIVSNINSDFTFLDLFKNKQSSKITIKLSGKLELFRDNNKETGYLDIVATSNKTAPESASITQLEEIWDSNLNNVIGKFDKEFRDQIKVLSQFLG